ncbi:TPA: acyltransferase family protein [Enterobacter roggenkampii]|nr:acyltransferase [Escherichia coli]
MSRMVRYESLDVVRGFAALSVVIAHTTSAVLIDNPDIWKWLEWSPLRFLFAGHQAVIMFFVLSGFALTVMIKSIPKYNYTKYITARIIRLWPPYAASILLTIAIVNLLKMFNLEWYNGWSGIAPFDMEKSDIIGNLTMLGVFNPFSINPPIWSLIQEMRVSIIFPLILFMVMKYNIKALICFILISIICCVYFKGTMYANLALAKDSYIFTASFFSPFALGCFIAINIERILNTISSYSTGKVWVIFLISYTIYSYSFSRPWSATARLVGDIIISLSSAIMLCVSLKIKDGIFMKIGKYLGKISYSLYLTHISVLTVLMTTLYKTHTPFIVWVLMLPASILLADIFTRTIDRLSINFSRKIYKR